MKYRSLGRTNWQVSEVGYGMWGLAGWTGSDIKETEEALDLAVESGCNFFDTAWAYAAGKSESILADLLKRHASTKLYVATKIPPKNWQWPAKKEFLLKDVYPADHIIEYTEKSLKNLKLDCIDLQQFHVWTDEWAMDESWMRAVEKLKADGKIHSMGISINRWEPDNAIEALKTDLIDVVQVIYNIFDQNPEDRLFPICKEKNIGIIARVPFDEGSLTGTLTRDTVFPKDDFRSVYFCEENLIPTIERVEKLEHVVPDGMSLAELALRFILSNKTVSTTIPGMRKIRNVKANMKTGDGNGLPESLLRELKNHRWDRLPTEWSH